MRAVPVGGLLYSLLHLGGFAGDQTFYTRHSSGSHRVLELGCGDGRIAAALCLNQASPSIMQQQQQPPRDADGEDMAVFGTDESEFRPPGAYVGVELCSPFVAKAQARLASVPSAQIIEADFLEPLPAEVVGASDSVIISANTLFCTPRHTDLLAQCAAALTPGGMLLLDVYNANPWHEDASSSDDNDDEEEEAEEVDEVASLLVRVIDEDGLEWQCYERDPTVDATLQTITCSYEFRAPGDDAACDDLHEETLVHHYLLPEQLVRALYNCGFEVEAIEGDFCSTTFHPEESEHVVVRARLRLAE